MPRDRRDWCEANVRYDDRHSSFIMWKGWKSAHPIFRIWVTFDEKLPSPLYGLATYRHPKVDRQYFTARDELVRRQGQDNLWIVGVHAYGVDCHESAVMSAVPIAQQLAPASANLAALVDETPLHREAGPTSLRHRRRAAGGPRQGAPPGSRSTMRRSALARHRTMSSRPDTAGSRASIVQRKWT